MVLNKSLLYSGRIEQTKPCIELYLAKLFVNKAQPIKGVHKGISNFAEELLCETPLVG